MNLQCPNCQAEYAVPPARLSEHPAVRCSACDHSWTIGGTEDDQETIGPEADEDDDTASGEPIDDAEDETLAAAIPESIGRLSPPLSTSKAPDRWLAAAWAASATAIAACAIAVCLYRTSVAAAWPPAGRLLAVSRAAPVNAPRPETIIQGTMSKP
jgi:predicted Zn finger-like uncharacterized protein